MEEASFTPASPPCITHPPAGHRPQQQAQSTAPPLLPQMQLSSAHDDSSAMEETDTPAWTQGDTHTAHASSPPSDTFSVARSPAPAASSSHDRPSSPSMFAGDHSAPSALAAILPAPAFDDDFEEGDFDEGDSGEDSRSRGDEFDHSENVDVNAAHDDEEGDEEESDGHSECEPEEAAEGLDDGGRSETESESEPVSKKPAVAHQAKKRKSQARQQSPRKRSKSNTRRKSSASAASPASARNAMSLNPHQLRVKTISALDPREDDLRIIGVDVVHQAAKTSSHLLLAMTGDWKKLGRNLGYAWICNGFGDVDVELWKCEHATGEQPVPLSPHWDAQNKRLIVSRCGSFSEYQSENFLRSRHGSAVHEQCGSKVQGTRKPASPYARLDTRGWGEITSIVDGKSVSGRQSFITVNEPLPTDQHISEVCWISGPLSSNPEVVTILREKSKRGAEAFTVLSGNRLIVQLGPNGERWTTQGLLDYGPLLAKGSSVTWSDVDAVKRGMIPIDFEGDGRGYNSEFILELPDGTLAIAEKQRICFATLKVKFGRACISAYHTIDSSNAGCRFYSITHLCWISQGALLVIDDGCFVRLVYDQTYALLKKAESWPQMSDVALRQERNRGNAAMEIAAPAASDRSKRPRRAVKRVPKRSLEEEAAFQAEVQRRLTSLIDKRKRSSTAHTSNSMRCGGHLRCDGLSCDCAMTENPHVCKSHGSDRCDCGIACQNSGEVMEEVYKRFYAEQAATEAAASRSSPSLPAASRRSDGDGPRLRVTSKSPNHTPEHAKTVPPHQARRRTAPANTHTQAAAAASTTSKRPRLPPPAERPPPPPPPRHGTAAASSSLLQRSAVKSETRDDIDMQTSDHETAELTQPEETKEEHADAATSRSDQPSRKRSKPSSVPIDLTDADADVDMSEAEAATPAASSVVHRAASIPPVLPTIVAAAAAAAAGRHAASSPSAAASSSSSSLSLPVGASSIPPIASLSADQRRIVHLQIQLTMQESNHAAELRSKMAEIEGWKSKYEAERDLRRTEAVRHQELVNKLLGIQ